MHPVFLLVRRLRSFSENDKNETTSDDESVFHIVCTAECRPILASPDQQKSSFYKEFKEIFQCFLHTQLDVFACIKYQNYFCRVFLFCSPFIS